MYVSGAALAKDSILAKEARHYRINADKVLREIRESTTKKSSKRKNHSKPQMYGTPKR
jgi:hypothetical protein